MIRRRSIPILSVLVVIALLLSSAGKAVAQGEEPPSSPMEAADSVGALAVLYDQQTTNPGALTDIATSQNFEAALDQYDTQAADDFVVPANEAWTVNVVEVLGVYDGSGSQVVSTVNVSLHADSGSGLPGTPVYGATLTPSSGATTGDFVITLSSPPTLGPGTYWLSIQANLDFDDGAGNTRQWFWRERTVASNNASAWQNPGNGDPTHLGQCTTWKARKAVCNIGNYADLLFRLSGNTATLNYHIYLPLTLKGS